LHLMPKWSTSRTCCQHGAHPSQTPHGLLRVTASKHARQCHPTHCLHNTLTHRQRHRASQPTACQPVPCGERQEEEQHQPLQQPLRLPGRRAARPEAACSPGAAPSEEARVQPGSTRGEQRTKRPSSMHKYGLFPCDAEGGAGVGAQGKKLRMSL